MAEPTPIRRKLTRKRVIFAVATLVLVAAILLILANAGPDRYIEVTFLNFQVSKFEDRTEAVVKVRNVSGRKLEFFPEFYSKGIPGTFATPETPSSIGVVTNKRASVPGGVSTRRFTIIRTTTGVFTIPTVATLEPSCSSTSIVLLPIDSGKGRVRILCTVKDSPLPRF